MILVFNNIIPAGCHHVRGARRARAIFWLLSLPPATTSRPSCCCHDTYACDKVALEILDSRSLICSQQYLLTPGPCCVVVKNHHFVLRVYHQSGIDRRRKSGRDVLHFVIKVASKIRAAILTKPLATTTGWQNGAYQRNHHQLRLSSGRKSLPRRIQDTQHKQFTLCFEFAHLQLGKAGYSGQLSRASARKPHEILQVQHNNRLHHATAHYKSILRIG